MNINKYGQPIGFPLPDWKPLPLPLRSQISGQHCNLLPLETSHCEALYQAYSLTEDDRDWTWLGAEKPADLQEMMLWITRKINDPSLVSWAVTDTKNNRPVGVVCYSNIDSVNGALEIGHVTWSPLMQKTSMGTDALFMLLKNAFNLGYRRVAWRCDSLNMASRNAAERIGFTFEGRFRQAMTRKQRNRDTDWFSVIDTQWPEIEKALSGWLSPENFEQNGTQKRRLETFFFNSQQ
ncbi:GNAT family N-acetyltransferase [Serratia sp. L9]|uniref:GNAT family N-acetyltransferase n=1 Tax=Serratia sp. L9 TaxID=3423946 RepID=UPI003D667017